MSLEKRGSKKLYFNFWETFWYMHKLFTKIWRGYQKMVSVCKRILGYFPSKSRMKFLYAAFMLAGIFFFKKKQKNPGSCVDNSTKISMKHIKFCIKISLQLLTFKTISGPKWNFTFFLATNLQAQQYLEKEVFSAQSHLKKFSKSKLFRQNWCYHWKN